MSNKKKKKNTKVAKKEQLSLSQRANRILEDPMLRFCIGFVLIIGLFYLFYTTLYKSWFQDAISNVNAVVGSVILNLLGYGTTAQEANITGSFAMNIKRGCDAIEPMALLIALILPFPAPLKRRLQGLLIGLLALAGLNVIRIVSLYMTGIAAPNLFEIMHIQVWQVLFILGALLYSAFWIRWVLLKQQGKVAA